MGRAIWKVETEVVGREEVEAIEGDSVCELFVGLTEAFRHRKLGEGEDGGYGEGGEVVVGNAVHRSVDGFRVFLVHILVFN